MVDNVSPRLENLTISKLKRIAQEYSLDISSCKHKKDFLVVVIAANITAEQVNRALGKSEEQSVHSQSEEERLENEIEEIAEKPSEISELPRQQNIDVERNIDQTLLMRPSFFEVDSQIETAWTRMMMGDYLEVLKMSQDARTKMLDRFSSFQLYTAALSIRAAESILNDLAQAQGKPIDHRIKTALAEAKNAFIEGSPRRREETLEELEKLAAKAYEAFFKGSISAATELRTMLADYESFGTQVSESSRLLDIAEEARQAYNISEYSTLVTQARDMAEKAKLVRAKEIEETLGFVKAALEEAREVGATPSMGEEELEQAKEALGKQAFKKAIDLLAAIEKTADQAHLERMRDNSIRTRQVDKITSTIENMGPALEEAASYGLEVQQGLLFVRSAQTALNGKDFVAAAKYARRLKQVSGPVKSDLDKKRIELGVAKKVEGAKCGKCGEEELYAHPDGIQKCNRCGHSFTIAHVIEQQGQSTDMNPIEKPVSSSKNDTQESSSEETNGERRTLARTLKR
ncbi:MAG: hypothetical protein IH630_05860 [Thermoplasmata archaeon]|nr:hypothetical protein [Thermoplasmata archaeon]